MLPSYITNYSKSGFSPQYSKLIKTEEIKSIVLGNNIKDRGLFSKKNIEKYFYNNKNISEPHALQLMHIATIEKWLDINTK